MPVTGLTASTSYDVQVSSTDESGNGPVTSSIVNFQTLAPPDILAPVIISGPYISTITHNSAIVSWETNEPATTLLNYGASNLSQNASIAGYRTQHEVILNGLLAITQYDLEVSTLDSVGNGPTISPVASFYTLEAPDILPPVIVSGPMVTNITDTEATIVWETDEPSVSGVSLNDGTAYTVYRDENLSVLHEIRITDLTASTLYHFTVSSTDGLGNGPTLSDQKDFSTLDTPITGPPVLIGKIKVVGITDHSARINWKTDDGIDTVIRYGTSANVLDTLVSGDLIKGGHVAHLNGLEKNTEYFFRAYSTDSSGNELVSEVLSFRTRTHPDNKEPKFTKSPTIVHQTDTTATIEWETDEPVESSVKYGVGQNKNIHKSKKEQSTKHQITLVGLTPNQSHSFEVSCKDSSGNQSSHASNYVAQLNKQDDQSMLASILSEVVSSAYAAVSTTGFTTNANADVVAPQFTMLPQVESNSANHLIIHWQTDEATNFQIQYALSGQQRNLVNADIDFKKNHIAVLSNLTSGTAYDVQVIATDVAGNQLQSSVFTTSTSAQPDTQAPVFALSPTIFAVSDTELLAIWTTDEYVSAELKCVIPDTNYTWQNSLIGLGTSHSIHLNGMDAGTSYECRVESTDLSGNTLLSDPILVTTTGVATDTDGDGIADNQEVIIGTDSSLADTDTDGVNDGIDAFPLDINETVDTDNDGTGNNADLDDDDDGMPDIYEDANGLDKLDATDADSDLDNDGISNLSEYQNGTNVAVDEVPPVFAAPDDLSINATGYLTAVFLTPIDVVDSKDGTLQATADKTGPFISGTHVITWSVTDLSGNSTTDTQLISIKPLVTFGQDQTVGEGQTVSVDITLSGAPLAYPVTIAYIIDTNTGTSDSNDHDLQNGSVTIDQGLTASISFDTVDDGIGEGSETLILTLDSVTNAAIGSDSQISLTLVENNIQPMASLSVSQANTATLTAVSTGGLVTVQSTVTDPNVGEQHIYDWSLTDNNLVDLDSDEATLTFNPASVSSGVYNIVLIVTDSGGLSSQVSQNIRKVSTPKILLSTQDTDGDGTADADEGTGDSDGDGIENYRDHNQEPAHMLPIGNGRHLSTQNGLTLTVGKTAFAANASTATTTEDNIGDHGEAAVGVNVVDDQFTPQSEIIDFVINGLSQPGDMVSIIIPLPQPIPENAVYRKFLTTQGWVTLEVGNGYAIASATSQSGVCPDQSSSAYQIGLNENDDCVRLTLVDGGIYDGDGLVNGSIADPGVIAVATSADTDSGNSNTSNTTGNSSSSNDTGNGNASSTTGSSSSSGGGGGVYTINFLLVMILLMLIQVRMRRGAL